LILIAAVALVEIARVLRDARRARRMNRAMHELRRPLQAIALGLESASPDLGGAGACLEQARGALRELDGIINGRADQAIVRRARIADVLESLERRWSFADVAVERRCPEVEIDADVTRLGAALDNLVVNALRHGSGVVTVRVLTGGGNARFEVRDCGPAPIAAGGRPVRGPRHGHGLRVVADVAATHGGAATAARPAPGGGTLAAITLPVSREPLGA
jgi:signal transduction histidine kinase